MISLASILFDKKEDVTIAFQKLENKLQKAVEDFLIKNKKEKLDAIVPKIKNLLKNQFAHKQSDKKVFRGISMSLEEFSHNFWKNLNEEQKTLFYKIRDNLVDPNDFSTMKNVLLKPAKHSHVQSWSQKKDIALSFAGGSSITVLCCAKMKEPNLFFGEPGQLAKTVEDSFSEEKETISVGDVLCDEIYFGPSVANQGIQKKIKSKIYSEK